MKRLGGVLLLLLVLCGCEKENRQIERGMRLRDRLLASSCSFDVEITADYGDKLHTFSLACQGNNKGDLSFNVLSPESISGITGEISDEGGNLTFGDTALHFELLAEGQLSPVSAPWILLKTLRSGYLTSAGMEGDLLRLTINDSYGDDALQLDIWLDGSDVPLRAEVLYADRRILTMDVTNFQIQ